MTRYAHVALICANCGQEFSGFVLQSTNFFGGSPELDTRPCGMARDATLRDIQQCPSCGYCSPDVTQSPEGSADTIKSDAYQRQINNNQLPKFCRKWACWGQILEASGEYSGAGWAYLNGAWECDDRRNDELAVTYRKQAVTCFRSAQENRQAFGEDSATELAIIIDLLRRTRQFSDAADLAKTIPELLGKLESEEKQLISSVIRFQVHLIQIADPKAYTFSEADRFAAAPEKWHPPKWWEFWR